MSQHTTCTDQCLLRNQTVCLQLVRGKTQQNVAKAGSKVAPISAPEDDFGSGIFTMAPVLASRPGQALLRKLSMSGP